MSSEIFKVQIPIETNADEAEALVYNADRSKTYFLPVTSALLAFMDGKPKKFAHAHIEESNLVIDREAPWQDW